ncbi:MAG TPA: MFS transporter [Burkholderiaceae bacterium]|nr:MFS transporter [Burkholderiaceae bacterium]
MFLAFALAYFFSALLRAVTATLAPTFSAELGLSAGDLGLLAGAYFLGFSLTQLPLGRQLDRLGPRRVLLGLLSVAALACVGFALAQSFGALLATRALIGVGVAACLMAPMTAYRQRFEPDLQLRANSWMLMTGSLGMLASTLPVQWLLPLLGWRGLFWCVAVALLLAMLVIAWRVPADPPVSCAPAVTGGYREIFRQPYFLRMLPLGFCVYGGLLAVQSLWAGPWLTTVSGWTPAQAAGGLFVINASMLVAFFGWGAVIPRLARRGWDANRLITWSVPVSLALLAGAVLKGASADAWWWAAWCVSCTAVSLAQPAVGHAFPTAVAGRALSAYNLVIFGGVFFMQWGIGLTIDALVAAGRPRAEAFRLAFAAFAVASAASYGWFLLRRGPR